MEEWVVTYRVEQTGRSNWGIVEFFRGSEEECRRIERAFAGGSSDTVATEKWKCGIGKAEDWEQFLKETGQ
jgi:hypothetical protein